MINTVLFLLDDILSLKTDGNVPKSKKLVQKKIGKNIFLLAS
jgi:hypothetical protein